MLSSADVALVRRDTCLPGLGSLLDPESALETLQAGFPELGLRTARAHYVRYKPRTSCLIYYETNTAAGFQLFYARAHRADAHEKLDKARETAAKGQRALFNEQATVLHRFPDDRRLRRLTELLDDAQRKRLLRNLLPESPHLWQGSLTPLIYKPERRFVAKLETPSNTVALKMYTKAGFEKAKAKARAFARHNKLRPASCLGHSDKHCMLAFDWLPGRTLREALFDKAFDLAMFREVGAALAELHKQAAEELPVRSRLEEAKRLSALANWLAWLLPDSAKRVQALTSKLCHCFLAAPPQMSAVHGDFYGKQILVQTEGVGVLDFDEALRGDPAHDLGLFIAHLERDALRGRLDTTLVDAAKATFLEGYHEASGALPPRIDLYTAAGLMGLAPHFFRNRMPTWPESTEALIDRAEEILLAAISHKQGRRLF